MQRELTWSWILTASGILLRARYNRGIWSCQMWEVGLYSIGRGNAGPSSSVQQHLLSPGAVLGLESFQPFLAVKTSRLLSRRASNSAHDGPTPSESPMYKPLVIQYATPTLPSQRPLTYLQKQKPPSPSDTPPASPAPHPPTPPSPSPTPTAPPPPAYP